MVLGKELHMMSTEDIQMLETCFVVSETVHLSKLLLFLF